MEGALLWEVSLPSIEPEIKQIDTFFANFTVHRDGADICSVVSCSVVVEPFVKGIDMTRKVMIDNYTLTDFTMGDYAWLIGNALAYGIIEMAVYVVYEFAWSL